MLLMHDDASLSVRVATTVCKLFMSLVEQTWFQLPETFLRSSLPVYVD
jgi:hypothetical protein